MVKGVFSNYRGDKRTQSKKQILIEIGLHTEFIGEIVDVKADSSVLNEKNLPDIKKVRPILWNPAENTYHEVGKRLGKAFSMGKEIAHAKKKTN